MYSPGGRTARTPGSAKLIAAAVSIALMVMAGAALAAPNADPGPPEQAQGNGPPPQAQSNGPPPQAHNPTPAPASAKAKAKAPGKPAVATPEQAPQAPGGSGSAPGAGQSVRGSSGHGRPAPGEVRGQGHIRSKAAKSKGCQAAGCLGGTPEPSPGSGDEGVEQPTPSRGKRDAHKRHVVKERLDRDHGGAASDLGSVQGLNQGGGEEDYAARSNFDGALPFTGFEIALLAGIGMLLALAGVWLRRTFA